jgi:cbb3-type cytochrome oxidase subunit 1
MAQIDIAFFVLASVCLVIGVCLGIYMGVNEDFQLVAVHTHVNLVGWVSLALFAVVYRLYPALAVSRLARIHFWLAVPSALAFPVGIYLAQVHQIFVVAIATSLLWLAGRWYSLPSWQSSRFRNHRQPRSWRQVSESAAIFSTIAWQQDTS